MSALTQEQLKNVVNIPNGIRIKDDDVVEVRLNVADAFNDLVDDLDKPTRPSTTAFSHDKLPIKLCPSAEGSQLYRVGVSHSLM